MKRACSIVAGTALLLALAGCGTSSADGDGEPSDMVAKAPSRAAKASEPPPAPEPSAPEPSAPEPSAAVTEAEDTSVWPTAADAVCAPGAQAADEAKAGSPDAEARALNLSIVARDVADALAALPTETAAEQDAVDAADRWADAWGIFAVAIYDGSIEEASAAGEDASAALGELTAAFGEVDAGECLALAGKF